MCYYYRHVKYHKCSHTDQFKNHAIPTKSRLCSRAIMGEDCETKYKLKYTWMVEDYCLWCKKNLVRKAEKEYWKDNVQFDYCLEFLEPSIHEAIRSEFAAVSKEALKNFSNEGVRKKLRSMLEKLFGLVGKTEIPEGYFLTGTGQD